MNYKQNILFMMLPLLLSCSAHTNIEPVGEGNLIGSINFGGPIVSAFDSKVPIPYLSAGVDYGLKDDIDLNGNLHLLPLFYELAGAETGVSYYPIKNEGYLPTVAINARFMCFSSFKSSVSDRFRLYPVLGMSYAWKLYGGMIYTGSDFVTAINNPDYSDESTIIISPFVGYRFKIYGNYNLFTEIKWQGINHETDRLAVEYVHPGGMGAIGIYLSLTRSFK